MRIFLAGTAALALAATGAIAQGNGKGNGNGNGNGKPAAAQTNGGGKSKADRGPERQQNRGNGQGNAKADRGNDKRPVQADRGNRGNGNGNSNGNDRSPVQRSNGNGNDRNDVRIRYDDRGGDRRNAGNRYDGGGFWLANDRNRGLVNGCPPGLAKKRNGCNPPGQVKDSYQRSLFGSNYRPSLFGLSNYGRGDYSYRDGYLVRYGDRGGISGWIPLLGGALGIGNIWPTGYQSYDVPDYYVDYYGLGGRDRYRYADNVIYRVDPEDAAIMSVAALITGDEFSVGQPMPRGYDVYNVPSPYRDRYYDSPDAMYRYSDGYVYRVDPETRLVAAAIDLLT